MASANAELQKACFAALTADAGVAAALPLFSVNGRNVLPIFDLVPAAVVDAYRQGAAPTYVTIGEGNETYDLAGEIEDEGDDVEITKHAMSFVVYSQTVGMIQAKDVAVAIRIALKRAYATGALALPTNTILNFDPFRIEYGRLPDGFTPYAAVMFKVLTQPTT